MACNYFSHDSNARNSKKIIRLRQKYGAAGYGVYFMILERLREEEGYMSEADYDMISFDLHEDAELIRSVVEDFGLFEKTDDGKYFFSEGFEERMALKDARSKAGKKGASARYCKNENGDGMAQNGKIMANENFAISKNVAKNNLPEFAIGNSFLKESKGKKRKENSSSSFSSSSTSSEKAEEERSEEEQQQEVFLERMFFEKNWAAPNEEMKKFIAFNNTGGRRWSRMSPVEREAAFSLWKQVPEQRPRCTKEQLLLWRSVVDELKRMGAPPDLIMAALSDKVAFTSRGSRFILAVPHTLAAFIDKHMAAFKPAFQQFLTSSGFENNTFNYVYTDEN